MSRKRGKHSPSRRIGSDARRVELLEALGFKTTELTWEQALQNVRELRRAVADRAGAP